jgi:IS5 family transposase
LWEAILPEMCLGMPAELQAVDRLLDDPTFFEPFRAHFHSVLGRPSVPIETYLRLMFLKYRYRLGFEPLCREVADSISWQRFCRIPLGVTVPHPTTLMKITTRCGPAAVDGLNAALLAKAAAAKVLKTNRVRADTTVVPANVAYPTDSGLLAKGVAKMAKAVERLKAGRTALGGAVSLVDLHFYLSSVHTIFRCFAVFRGQSRTALEPGHGPESTELNLAHCPIHWS